MGKEYVLFDWDNTVRRGYTLFSWIDYLCNNDVIEKGFKNEIAKVRLQYSMNSITHDQYAKIACEKYAEALKGISEKTVLKAVSQYIELDKKTLFSNIGSLFDVIRNKEVEIIVISGAPILVLSSYQKEYHIDKIYAFKETVRDGIFTGRVDYNYGFDKRVKVQEIINYYGRFPLMAFGDSVSDIPMLECASHPFCVGNGLEGFRNITITKDNRIPQRVLATIGRILEGRPVK